MHPQLRERQPRALRRSGGGAQQRQRGVPAFQQGPRGQVRCAERGDGAQVQGPVSGDETGEGRAVACGEGADRERAGKRRVCFHDVSSRCGALNLGLTGRIWEIDSPD
nr:hypothetical protein GCM10020093_009080 [Planobispora longispora]